MFERFTDRARNVMATANREAHKLNHEYIGTEHLLLALVHEAGPISVSVLKSFGVDEQRVREEIGKLVEAGPDIDVATEGKLPQTPRAKNVIKYAFEESQGLNHRYVGTEHILLGLLRETDGVASKVLTTLGLELKEVRKKVLNLLGASDTEPKKPTNLRRGFRRITLVSAIIVGLICGFTISGILLHKRISAQRHLDNCIIEFTQLIPVGPRPAGWPEWKEKEDSHYTYYERVCDYLFYKQLYLPVLTGEEDAKFRREHNIPPDSTNWFYTDESMEFMRKYGKCIEKAGALRGAHNDWTSLSTNQFIGLFVLAGLGCAIAGFCGVWIVYFSVLLIHRLVKWMTVGFHIDTG